MSLAGTDLNLLLSLKVLLEEGNVTRAGHRLELSQPAMSAALARLRRRFDDELLVRSGREYELTPLAKDLLPEVQHAVRLVTRAFALEDEFDPGGSRRTFRLSMSDYAISVIHAPLLRIIGSRAPGIRLEIEGLDPDIRIADRALVEFDAVVAPLGFGFPGDSVPLWRDRMVLIADRSHSRLEAGAFTLEALREVPHAVAGFGPGIVTPADRVFDELGIDRRVTLKVRGFLPLPFVIAGTEMVAVVPERLAKLHLGHGSPLMVVESPFGEVVLAEGCWFGHDRRSDPAHRWLLARFEELAVELSGHNT